MKNSVSLNLIISIIVAVVLVTLGAYFAIVQLSAPAEQDLMSDFKASQPITATSNSQASNAGLASVDLMLVGLKQRLETQPDDVDGWVLLSKSYYHVNRWKEAEAAFEKAKALGYTGSWQPLPRIDSFSQNGSTSQKFDSSINFRDYKINEDVDQAKSQVDDTTNQSGLKKSTSLKLKVSLNPALQNELSSESPVFVFVRAVENPGPPLAVIRKKVGELPFEIALNDSHAMIAGRTISSAENVIVGVRISVSGNPERQPGDFEQLSNTIPSDFDDTLELVIKDKI
jgi:hypothetical protein